MTGVPDEHVKNAAWAISALHPRTVWLDFRREARAALEAVGLPALLERAEAWNAKCDEAGLPHDPEVLVRHHRANAALASEFDRLALEAERDALAVKVADSWDQGYTVGWQHGEQCIDGSDRPNPYRAALEGTEA